MGRQDSIHIRPQRKLRDLSSGHRCISHIVLSIRLHCENTAEYGLIIRKTDFYVSFLVGKNPFLQQIVLILDFQIKFLDAGKLIHGGHLQHDAVMPSVYQLPISHFLQSRYHRTFPVPDQRHGMTHIMAPIGE